MTISEWEKMMLASYDHKCPKCGRYTSSNVPNPTADFICNDCWCKGELSERGIKVNIKYKDKCDKCGSKIFGGDKCYCDYLEKIKVKIVEIENALEQLRSTDSIWQRMLIGAIEANDDNAYNEAREMQNKRDIEELKLMNDLRKYNDIMEAQNGRIQ